MDKDKATKYREIEDYIKSVRKKCDVWQAKRSASCNHSQNETSQQAPTVPVNVSSLLKSLTSTVTTAGTKSTETPKFMQKPNLNKQVAFDAVPQIRDFSLTKDVDRTPPDLSSGRGLASTPSEEQIKSFIKSYY